VKRRRTRRSLRVKRAKERPCRAALRFFVDWTLSHPSKADLRYKAVSDTLNRGYVVPKSVWS